MHHGKFSAPQNGKMSRRIRENISGADVYTLMYKGRIVLKEVTDKAAFECEINEHETK